MIEESSMKKRMIVLMLLLLLPINVLADSVKMPRPNGSGYVSYDEAIASVQEVMRSFYIRGSNIQYNFAKTKYGNPDGDQYPEDATSQDTFYAVCGAYAYDVYAEMLGTSNNFPSYTLAYISDVKRHYNANDLDGNHVIYYYQQGETDYIYQLRDEPAEANNEVTVSDMAALIKPGDILATAKHTMVAYKIVERTAYNGEKFNDVLLLNSTRRGEIKSRISGTSNLSYNVFKSKLFTNYNGTESSLLANILNNEEEGTVQMLWLSEYSSLAQKDKSICPEGEINCIINSKFECGSTECAILRVFHKDENSNDAVFDYNVTGDANIASFARSELRKEYPGLYIEKTVDAFDNNTVNIGDTLEYTIKITNKSNTTPTNAKAYDGFYIKEEIGDLVNYVSTTNSGEHIGNTIIWHIDELSIGETITLKYIVTVKDNPDNYDEEIKSIGKFYKTEDNVFIPTGTVKNAITYEMTIENNNYSACFDEYKNSYEGLALIDKVYECVLGDNKKFSLNFENNTFNFNKLFRKIDKISDTKANYANSIGLKTEFDDQKYQMVKNMVFNNYYSGLFLTGKCEDASTYLPSTPSQEDDELDPGDGESDDEGEGTTYQNGQICHATGITNTKWRPTGSEAASRRKTIYGDMFENGDILIYSIDYDGYTYDAVYNKFNGITYVTPENITGQLKTTRHTKEKGTYAFIYIDGKFEGVNYPNTERERSTFNYLYYYDVWNNYYKDKDDNPYSSILSYYRNNFYGEANNGAGNLWDTNTFSSTRRKQIVEHVNYQTLYGKDDYVILRPKQFHPTIEITYYQGNNASGAGETAVGTTICDLPLENCLLKTAAELGINTLPKGWHFIGWSLSPTQTDLTINFADGEAYHQETYTDSVKLYAIYERNFQFYSGIAPTNVSQTYKQYYRPYQSTTDYVSSVAIPEATQICENQPGAWTFLGWRVADELSSTVYVPASAAGTAYKVRSVLTTGNWRGKYERDVTLTFDLNGGEGNIDNITITQYYTTGYGNGTTNVGANISELTYSLPSGSNLTREGYTFKGWTETKGLPIPIEGETYTYKPTVNNCESTIKTLYAIWENDEYKKGDMNKNGNIDLADIIILLKRYLNGNTTNEELVIGDMDENGSIGLRDVILLLKVYLYTT